MNHPSPRRVLVIAEAGVNHNGSAEMAHTLVEAAHRAGADVVKFQTFRAELVVSTHAPKAEYQLATTAKDESQLAMIRKLELSDETFASLARHAAQIGIEFMSTPFDLPSLAMLVGIGVRRLKVPSGELTNPILLRAAARTGLPLIMSTGMATLGEVEHAVDVLEAADAAAGLRDRLTLLHCTTEYPAPYEAVNLRAMVTMGAALGLPIGYSDHTLGTAVSIGAVALGATVVEKHFTLDRNLEGPDHRASLEPSELAAMVEGIRAIEQALGSPIKRPAPAERKNIAIARRSLVAARAIRVGERFDAENLTVKRPGSGVSAIYYDAYLGRIATRAYAPDELIDP